MTNREKIELTIRDGRLIADTIRNASNIQELNNAVERIEQYCDFVDKNFGILNDIDNERECSLTTSLYVALDWKKKALYPENKNNPSANQLANNYLEQFVEELDSKKWTEGATQ